MKKRETTFFGQYAKWCDFSEKSYSSNLFQIKRRKKKRTYLLEDNDNGNDITATATFANVNDDDRQKKRLPCLKEDIVFPVIICKLDLAKMYS